MAEPTREQIREFWERLADEIEHFADDRHRHYKFGASWEQDELPINLNNLFKYAVPKLREQYNDLRILFNFGSVTFCSIYGWGKKYSRKKNFKWLKIGDRTDDDPALALFWAIYSVIRDVAKA